MTSFLLSVDARPGGVVIPLCEATILEATEVVFLMGVYAERGGTPLPTGIGGVLGEAILMFKILLLNVGESLEEDFGLSGLMTLTRTS